MDVSRFKGSEPGVERMAFVVGSRIAVAPSHRWKLYAEAVTDASSWYSPAGLVYKVCSATVVSRCGKIYMMARHLICSTRAIDKI